MPLGRRMPIQVLAAVLVFSGALFGTYAVINLPDGDVLYMRDKPSSSGKIVGAIPSDGLGIFKSGKCSGGWCRMKYNGKTGWVNMRYLSYIKG
jgi:SH3-like domain-containing protein